MKVVKNLLFWLRPRTYYLGFVLLGVRKRVETAEAPESSSIDVSDSLIDTVPPTSYPHARETTKKWKNSFEAVSPPM